MTREQIVAEAKVRGLDLTDFPELTELMEILCQIERAEMREQCAKVCELKVCGSQGFAGPSCCILPPGHDGNHNYGVPMAKTQAQCAAAIRNLEV